MLKAKKRLIEMGFKFQYGIGGMLVKVNILLKKLTGKRGDLKAGEQK